MQLTIKKRIYILVILSILLGLSLGGISLYSLRKAEDIAGERLLQTLYKGQQDRLQLATHTIAIALGDLLKAVNDPDEQTRLIRESISSIRFEDDQSGYYFVYEGTVNVALPPNPAIQGKDLANTADANGVFFVRELAARARAGGGFVEYVFPKPGQGDQPKLGYAQMIPGTSTWIGTGIYIDNLQVLQAEGLAAMQASLAPLKRLFIAIALFLVALIGIISELINRSISRPLISAIQSLSSGSQEISSAANQVSGSSQSLAEGANEQASSLEETSSSMEEMRAMMDSNAAVASQTNKHSKGAATAATEGVQSMNELRERVDAVGSSAREMESAMQAIKQSSDSIAKIIKTIDEIAFQTNILALNAAVEAARAGEAGAGFAVVADEGRSLARRAADAASETATMIEDSIKRSQRGVQVNNEVSKNLEAVLQRAGKVEEVFKSIAGSVTDVHAAMGELELSVRNQQDGIRQINAAVGQVSDVTQQNAANAEEVASASEQMNAQSVALLEIVDSLTRMVYGRST
jgi:methyl-accepting chemotaxis protein